MTAALIPGFVTFSCSSGVHWKCSGSRWSFTRQASVRCACDCHEAAVA